MKKFLHGAVLATIALVGATLIATPVLAAEDRSITFEIGVGFGKSASHDRVKKSNQKVCRNRQWDGMLMGAVRVRYDDIEVHGARWFHDADYPTCDRDAYAVGVGYVMSTEDDGTRGDDDWHASWTPGLAYTWGENKNFTGQEADGTNWRLHNNWQLYNRVAIGYGNEDLDIEVAAHRYGTWNFNHGENFVTVGLALKDLDNNDRNDNGGSTNGDDGTDGNDGEDGTDGTDGTGGDITIVNEITIINNNVVVVNGGTDGQDGTDGKDGTDGEDGTDGDDSDDRGHHNHSGGHDDTNPGGGGNDRGIHNPGGSKHD